MRLRVFCVCILLIFITIPSFAQSKPEWLTNLEKAINQKEKTWKVDNKLERYENYSFDYNLTLKSRGAILSIQIIRLNNVPNAEETFAGQAVAFSNTMGKKAIKTKLKNFGDEANLWRGNGFVMLDFRKDDIFMHIFTSSEVSAKRFARYILEHIPKK
jgi:hypothetical protein